jgi:dTDP-4-amino-4,6-dideoxygalactose transaminase
VTDQELIPLFDLEVTEQDIAAITATMRSGWLTMGPRIAELEEVFAAHLGCKHAVAVSSCTAALHLAYAALDIGPGDEVIVPSYTFVATAAAVIYLGATPIFADIIGPEDLSIDPEHVASLIGPKTKAVTAVHFAGYPAPIEELKALCDKHGIALVEDAAHTPSAVAGTPPRKLGTFGAAGCFSFFSNKVLPAGEGGLVATDDDKIAATVRSLRSHAMTSGTWDRHTGHAPSYDVLDVGFNYRLDEPRAALLLSRLPRLEADIEARREHTRMYRQALAGLAGLTVPYADDQVAQSSAYVMAVICDDEGVQGPLRTKLREKWGVQTSLFYPAIHEFTAYKKRFGELSLPRTERAARTEITLPLFGHLTTAQRDRVIEGLMTELPALAPAQSAG